MLDGRKLAMHNKKVDDFRVSGTVHDKRIKLTVIDKIDIIALHSEGMGIRESSRVYHVSRRTIQFVLFPERLEHNKQLREDRGNTMIRRNTLSV